MTRTAWCEVQDIHGLDYRQLLSGSWLLALLTGLALILGQYVLPRPGRNGWTAAGFALMTIPVWMVLIDVLPDMVRTFCVQGDVVAVTNLHPRPFEPYSTRHLSDNYIGALLRNLGYIALGALLVLQGRRPGWWRSPRIPTMARDLRGLLPMGRGELASLRAGIAIFPALAIGNLALLALTGTPVETAGRGPLYSQMTAFHAPMLALAAGVGEELVFRGVLQQGLIAILRRHAPRLPIWGAGALIVPLVAVPFAYSHASYGNPPLLLFAFLFSIIASVAALWLGIWAAIALHALIDFYAFFVSVPKPDAVFFGLAVAVAAGVLLVTGRHIVHGVRKLQAERSQ